VLAVTWYKTVGIVREAYRLGTRVPIGEIVLRDGKLSVFCELPKDRAHRFASFIIPKIRSRTRHILFSVNAIQVICAIVRSLTSSNRGVLCIYIFEILLSYVVCSVSISRSIDTKLH
jgi:hypothetical protein